MICLSAETESVLDCGVVEAKGRAISVVCVKWPLPPSINMHGHIQVVDSLLMTRHLWLVIWHETWLHLLMTCESTLWLVKPVCRRRWWSTESVLLS